MKKIKKKTFIRFNAKPQPGILLAVYTKLQKTNYILIKDYLDAEDAYFNNSQWNEIEGIDLLLVSTLFEEPLPISKVSLSNEGFDIPTYAKAFTPLIEYGVAEQGSPYYLYVNKEKEIIFREVDGEKSTIRDDTQPYQTKAGTSTLDKDQYKDLTGIEISSAFIDVPHIEKMYLGEFQTRLWVKEYKLNMTSKMWEDIGILYTQVSPRLSAKKERVVILPDGSQVPDPTYFEWEGNTRGSVQSMTLSYHGAIFGSIQKDVSVETITDLNGNTIPQPPQTVVFPEGASDWYYIKDEWGVQEKFNNDAGFFKFATQIEGYTMPSPYGDRTNPFYRQLYFGYMRNVTSYLFQDQVVFKAFDSETYIVDKVERGLIWKNGKEYLLPQTYSYNINNIETPVPLNSWRIGRFGPVYNTACFAEYFAARHMMMTYKGKRPSDGDDGYIVHRTNNYEEEFYGWDNSCYRISSWFGDFIYKVRVDEFYDGTFFFDELIKNDFALDTLVIINKQIKRDLKIYRPGLTSLWVEKYQVILNESESAAEIKYITRFQVSLTPPVDELLDYDPLLNIYDYPISALTKLKQIIYVPNN